MALTSVSYSARIRATCASSPVGPGWPLFGSGGPSGAVVTTIVGVIMPIIKPVSSKLYESSSRIGCRTWENFDEVVGPAFTDRGRVPFT